MVNKFLTQNKNYCGNEIQNDDIEFELGQYGKNRVNFQKNNKLDEDDKSSDDTFELLHSKPNQQDKGILDTSEESNGEEDLLNLSQTEADPSTVDRRQHEMLQGSINQAP